MRKISEIKVGGKTVIVRELTVFQVEQQLEEMAGQEQPTTLDWMFAQDYMPQAVLEKITEAEMANILTDEITPSDLEPLYKEALKINPFLAKALRQMRDIATLMKGMEIVGGSGLPPST